jgi:hypothetical protein
MAMVLAGALILPLQVGAQTPVSPTVSPVKPGPTPDCRDYPTCLQYPVCVADSRCKGPELEVPPRPPQRPRVPARPDVTPVGPPIEVPVVVPPQPPTPRDDKKQHKEIVKVKVQDNLKTDRFRMRGSDWDIPILPVRTFTIPGRPGGPARNGFVLQMVVIQQVRIIIDPVIAVGYDYFVDKGPKVTEIELPEGIGDNLYELWLFDNGANDFVNTGVTIAGGEPYTLSEPVDKFSIRGIEVDAGLDPEDELAFPTGLKFVDSGEVEMRMISITVDTDQN